MASVKDLYARMSMTRRFLEADVWRVRADTLTPGKSFGITQLRILLLAVRKFAGDRCDLRASALTFYCLMSIVPVVAMAFGVAKGFGLERLFEAQLMARLENQPEVADRLIGFSRALLENTRGGAIAGVGVAVLFWTVVKLLGNIESSFNDIWGVTTGRRMGRKVADYLSVVMICPVLLIIASSATVLVTTQVSAMMQRLSFLGYAASVIIVGLRVLPYAVTWGMFTFVYVFMPNTAVAPGAGVRAGIVAGTVFQLAEVAYIKFQVGVASYGAIYGSFAALPLLLAWLQLSWMIVLFGAEVSFATQNVRAFELEADCATLSHAARRRVALAIARHCVEAFSRGRTPPSADEISSELELPIRLVRSTLSELTAAGLLSEVGRDDRGAVAYQPGRPVDDLTIAGVLGSLDDRGTDAIPMAESGHGERIREVLRGLRETSAKSPDNVRIREL